MELGLRKRPGREKIMLLGRCGFDEARVLSGLLLFAVFGELQVFASTGFDLLYAG